MNVTALDNKISNKVALTGKKTQAKKQCFDSTSNDKQ